MKKINFSYFLAVFSLTMMISCSDNATEETRSIDNTELLLKQIELDKANSPYNPSNNPASAKSGGGGGNWTCYTAHMTYDYDCDGQADATYNAETTTWWCCWEQVVLMAAQAENTPGVCNYYYNTESQCASYSCSNSSDCGEESGEF